MVSDAAADHVHFSLKGLSFIWVLKMVSDAAADHVHFSLKGLSFIRV
jgi:hypothetical protein